MLVGITTAAIGRRSVGQNNIIFVNKTQIWASSARSEPVSYWSFSRCLLSPSGKRHGDVRCSPLYIQAHRHLHQLQQQEQEQQEQQEQPQSTKKHNDHGSESSPSRASLALQERHQQQTKQFQLTPAHLKDTTTILKPDYFYLSAGLGAALQSQTTVLRNIRKLGDFLEQLENIHDNNKSEDTAKNQEDPNNDKTRRQQQQLFRTCQLANRLFFQQHDGAPIRLTKNKSTPAAHMTAARFGNIWGTFALRAQASNEKNGEPLVSSLSPKQLSNLLKTNCGIRSNYVRVATSSPQKDHASPANNRETKQQQEDDKWLWTGVSLARWKELIECLSSPKSSSSPFNTNNSDLLYTLSRSLWHVALWETSQSKLDLLEYYLALEQSSGLEVLKSSKSQQGDELVSALRHDDLARQEWAATTFDVSKDLDTESVQSSLQLLLDNTGDPMKKNTENEQATEVGRALEIICASIAEFNQQAAVTAKPVVPHGKHSFDQGKPKPDCVEITVRELIDLLLWDERTGRFQIDRLPPSALPELRHLYTIDNQTNHNGNNGTINGIPDQQNQSPAVVDLGKEWHRMLSSIPDIDYLATSPHGKSYELSPTIQNVAKVCQKLLYPTTLRTTNIENDKNELTHKDKAELKQEQWTSLKQLQEAWNRNAPHEQQLQLALGTLKERAKVSGETLIHHVATMHLNQSSHAIEMRLRYDSWANTGFSTVTHLRLYGQHGSDPRQGKKDGLFLSDKQLESLMRMFAQQQQHHQLTDDYDDEKQSNTAFWLIPLALSLMRDRGLLHSRNQNDKHNISLTPLVISLLSAPYGLDRRKLMQLAGTTGLEREDDAYPAALRESQNVLKIAVQKICGQIQSDFSNDRNDENNNCLVSGHTEQEQYLGPLLLGWILTEAPQVSNNAVFSPSLTTLSYDSDIENAILSLPTEVTKTTTSTTKDSSSSSAVVFGLNQTEWLGRGKILSRFLSYKSGQVSFWKSFRYLSMSDTIALARLMMA